MERLSVMYRPAVRRRISRGLRPIKENCATSKMKSQSIERHVARFAIGERGDNESLEAYTWSTPISDFVPDCGNSSIFG